jgi:hypothetical protein
MTLEEQIEQLQHDLEVSRAELQRLTDTIGLKQIRLCDLLAERDHETMEGLRACVRLEERQKG